MKRSILYDEDKQINNSSRSTSPDIRNIKRKLNNNAITSNKKNNSKQSKKINETTTTTTAAAAAVRIENIKNHDVCDACGDVGRFICCDACPNSFHFTCVEPPIDSTDVAKLKDKWYCNECEYKYNKAKLPRSNPRGLFQKLIDNLNIKNPKAYQLPKDIIHFFDGVSADKQGRYIDTSQTKRVRYKNGEMEIPDYHQLKNKSGKFILCYYCRKTALRKPMIACDYCSLHWHLDCLNPPLASPPNPGKKWRCPNHIEHIIKPPRKLRKKTASIINDKVPACAYHDYLNTIIDDTIEINKNPIKQKQMITDNIITSKNGIVYRLPVQSIHFADFNDYAKR
ncbi:uncharacterized protein BX663DRAFT_151730 [Cokeromyces recurvatus]|uniref:uncharacterized protein n=1 Tax=Cokeromyces recurvatus TaxID=90255 RepID=UPI00221F696A|nr:uncharacterized protein BX663DRAFT_151730 [Cokeromyces recurvatus]KAI7900624.1 hypothetical protein BX663DRAFT_151730 [Cokeromyces recurvatus]